ncbi:VWA domain-containing protein [Halocola ammonii]
MNSENKTYRLTASIWTIVIFELTFWLSLAIFWYLAPEFLPGLRLHNPEWKWALLSLPVLTVFFILFSVLSYRRLKKLSDLKLTSFIVPHRSPLKSTIRFLILRLALALVIFGIIAPKIGSRLEEVTTKGADLMVVFDVSKSMLAEDVSPSRLERGKLSAQRLIEELHGDRIGLVVYASDAFVQMPITSDYQAARFFLSSISTNSVSRQGTSLGNAIDLAANSFDKESATQKAIIVITDGENHGDNAINAAGRAREKGITVHAIGLGTARGAPIPKNPDSRQKDYLKDADGNVVVSQMNATLLQELVEKGDGVFVQSAESYVPLDGIRQAIGEMQKAELGTFNFTDFEHRHQYFFGAALLMLVVYMLLSERRSNFTKTKTS